MDIAQLSLFLDVVRRGSFAAAAKECALDPSSVSRNIGKLEEELGFRLFQRSTRRLALTEAGQLFAKSVEGAIEEIKRARGAALDISNEVAGTLRLTASVAYGQMCVLPLLPRFRAAYPGIKLELLFTDSNLDFVGERVDLAIRLAPTLQGDVVAARLARTSYHVVASADYVAAHGRPGAPAELVRHSCLLLDLPGFYRSWRFRAAAGAEELVKINGDVTLSTPLALRGAALAGLGPALLADWLVADALADGRLVDLFPGHQVTQTDFNTAAWIVYPSRAFLPRKVRVMIDFLKAHLGGRGT